MRLAISEVFYSIQGEGITTGTPSVFVRLGGCNLMCGGMGTQFDNELHNGASWRCDTIEVWMKAQSKQYHECLCEFCAPRYCPKPAWLPYSNSLFPSDRLVARRSTGTNRLLR
jgi:hypothetical protein